MPESGDSTGVHSSMAEAAASVAKALQMYNSNQNFMSHAMSCLIFHTQSICAMSQICANAPWHRHGLYARQPKEIELRESAHKFV